MIDIKKQIPITAYLSFLAYDSSFSEWSVLALEKKLEAEGFEDFEWIENIKTDTQCFLCAKDGYLYLAFRGSSTDADWATNFDTELVTSIYGKVHKGFRDDARSVYWAIVHSLPKHLIKGRKLIITGHSQGAGVGCEFAIELLGTHRKIEAVIHFGGPRVTDGEAADLLDTKYPDLFHRVVNNNDVVTRMPPRLSGYKHFGKLHYFEGNGKYTEDISAWSRFLDRLKHKLDFGGEYKIDIFNDHAPAEYVALANKNFQESAA